MLSVSIRSVALSVSILLGVICLFVLSRLPEPKAIESAQNPNDLKEKIEGWGPQGCAGLGFALGFDYLFMAAYATAIGLGCAAVAGGAGTFLRQLGMLLAYAQAAGALIDATENASLIRLLLDGFDDRLMGIARFATASKFVIPLSGIGYILIAWLLRRWLRV